MKVKEKPLALVERMTELISSSSDVVRISEKEKTFYHLVDRRHEDFFFTIWHKNVRQQHSPPKPAEYFDIEFQPRSNIHHTNHVTVCNLAGLPDAYNKWVELVRKYNHFEDLSSDPFERAYEEEIYAGWELVDEDADQNPYSLKTQQRILEYLNNVESSIAEQTEISDSHRTELSKSVNELKSKIGSSTKRKVFKSLVRLWAKTGKISPELFRKVCVDLGAKLLVEIAIRSIKAIAQ